MVEVRLESLCKNFGKVKAVDGVTLKIKDKEFMTLLGPSGCGKTTTLRLIAGLEEATSGNIYIGDRLVNDFSPKERNIAMVFQSYALYPHMTVLDNIAFPLKLSKVQKHEITKRVAETADLLGIKELLDRKPKQLSGGQRQRVALGRAIVRNPEVYLFDEPLSNLDAKLRVYMRTELVRLQRRLGTTLIYVTHDQVEAMSMSDRIAIMNEGNIVQVDTATNTYDHPNGKWVAGFIGSPPMNFFNCSLIEKNGEKFLDTGDFVYRIPMDMQKLVDKRSGSELVLGVRPEDITIYDEKKSGLIEAEVYLVEPLGDCIVVDLAIGGNIIKARVASRTTMKGGSKAYLEFDDEKIHIFDKKTEKALV